MNLVDLALDAEGMEDGQVTGVARELGTAPGRGDLDESGDALEGGLRIDHDARHLAGEQVADGTHEQVALGVEQAGLLALFPSCLHVFPETGEVGQIALEFGLGAVEAGGSQDEAEALGQLELREDLLGGLAFVVVFFLAGDADLVHAGHHDEEAAGD